MSRCDKRFEAHPADDLFEGGIVAACRDEQSADRHLRGVFEIFAGQPSKAQPRASGGLEQQRTDVGLLLALAAQFNGIVGLDFDRPEWLAIDGSHDRPQE